MTYLTYSLLANLAMQNIFEISPYLAQMYLSMILNHLLMMLRCTHNVNLMIGKPPTFTHEMHKLYRHAQNYYILEIF